MALLLIVVALTLAVSAMCSLFEATLFSTQTTAVEAARASGQHRGSSERFLRMKRNLARPTSAILILNTIANTAGAAVAGMLAAKEVGNWFIPTFSAGLTLAILFVSEILPKTYGAVRWRRLWPVIVWPLAAMEALLRPLIYVTQLFARLLVPEKTDSHNTEEEILAMIRLSGRAGELTPSEQEMLTTVFAFDEVTAAEVLIPAAEVTVLNSAWSLEECLRHARETRHTRYPLSDGELGDAVGVIHIKDLVGVDAGTALQTLTHPLAVVPGTTPIPQLLRQMQRSRQHMNLVTDADGKVTGIITLEDVLGQIVGSVDEDEEPEIIAEGAHRYMVVGTIPMVALNDRLGLDIDHPSDVDTLSALMVRQLGRLLEVDDVVDFGGVTAEVIEVVGTQATQIRVVVTVDSEE